MTNLNEILSNAAAILPIAVSPSEAARLIGIGRTTLYSALASGALKSAKIGKRRLIPIAAINEWLENCTIKDVDDESIGGSK
ncbi:MAG: helix-turn-helix domain-containing protein [Paracoccaceae bacterium]